MSKRVAAAVTLVLLLAPLAAGSLIAPQAAPALPAMAPAPASPLAPWWQRSALDLDRDAVHDSLERLSPLDFPVVVIVDYLVTPEQADVAALQSLGLSVGVVLRSLDAVSASATSLAQLRAISALPGVVMVEMGGRPYMDLDVANANTKARPSKEYSPESAWELGYTGSSVVVAIMDTGVDNGHPGLVGRWVGGVDVSMPASRLFPRDGTFDADDTQGHGTSVSGMSIGTGAPDGTYAGIAPQAKLVDLRIGTIFGAAPGEGPLDVYDATLQGIDWAIAFHDHSWGGAVGIDVLSLSWGNNVGGSSDGSDVYSRGIDRLAQAGIIPVIAAGNAGPGNDGFDGLGSSSYAITIGATDDFNTIDRSDDDIASYSSRGPRKDNNDGYPFDELKPEVSASGTDIISAEFDRFGDGSGNTYGPRGSGTSYATPMVSGTVALMLDANPDLRGQWRLVKEILTHTAERRGNATLPEVDPFWNRDFGYGIVDAYKACLMAYALRGLVGTVDPELQAFIVNSSAGSRPVSESVTVTGVTYAKRGVVETLEAQVDEGAWFPFGQVDSGNLTNFTYAVDTRGFKDGNHTLRVRASSAGFVSLADEVTFAVKGAPPRVSSVVPSGFLFLALAVAVSAPIVYVVRRHQARMRLREEGPRENF